MINAQIWLDQEHPNKKEVTRIIAKNKDLEGNLVIKDFPNLEKIECSNNKNLASIELSDLSKLNHFRASNCHLTSVVVHNCSNITNFNVGNNLLASTKFLNALNPEKLTHLSVHSNNFEKQTLEFIGKFINLKELYIDNSDEEKFDQGIRNCFIGSLKPLQSLEKLRWLSLAKTDIDSGLEYLPKSIKKVGCKKDWSPKDASGCAKLCRELEKAAQVAGVTEKLVQEEENEPLAVRGKATWYRLAPWCQAKDLLGEEGFRKQISQQNAQAWLDKYYPKGTSKEEEKRENIDFLNNISGKNLVGRLDLSDFESLERLNCSWNQLTSLDLSNCKSLVKLNCSSNNFTSVDFLSEMPSKEKLSKLKLNNNEELKGTLVFLTPFIRLVELDIRGCSFYGSLEPLRKLNNLERVFISNTHISEGLEHLPDSCKEFYCDTSDYKYKSMEIVKELGKFLKERYYSVSEWKEDKQNRTLSMVVPLERLFVIRNNLKQFINKWNKDHENDWYESSKGFLQEKVLRKPKKEKNNELAKLQSPREAKWDRRIIFTSRALNNALAASGIILSFQGKSDIGAGLLGVYPINEFVITYIDKSLGNREVKWKEFLDDADVFSDNFNELIGIINSVRVGNDRLGKVSKAFRNLRQKVGEFLNEFDQADENGIKNGEIELEELVAKRGGLVQDLDKDKKESKVWAVVEAMKELESKVIDYRQGVNIEETNQTQNQSATSHQQTVINMSQSQNQTQALQIQPTIQPVIPGSSKTNP